MKASRKAALVAGALVLISAPILAHTEGNASPPTQAAAPQTLEALSAKAREARGKGDIARWLAYATRTLELAPDHPDILISVARAHAAAGDRPAAIAYLGQAARRGAGLEAHRLSEFAGFADDPAFVVQAAVARRNLASMNHVEEFATLAGPPAEGIAYDPVSKTFFAGTDQGEIYAIDSRGRPSLFLSGGGLRQILGLRVDPERRLLWLVSGRYPDPPIGDAAAPADSGTGGVRAYHLDSRKLVRAVEVDERPLQHGFNDMAITADGTLYVTDTASNSVYRLDTESSKLDLVIRDPAMSYPNGIVIAPDGRTLYVAHAEGISAIDPTTRSRRLLAVAEDASVNSIDGLQRRGDVLYGVQNSPYMHRVVAARLAADGLAISQTWGVTARSPAEYSHTTLALAGDHLYVIGGAPMPDVHGGTNPAPPVSKIWRAPLAG